MDYNKIIGDNIRYERQLRGFTIEELAEAIDMAPSFLGLVERGMRGTTIKNLCKLSVFFSLSLDELIKRDINAIMTENDRLTAFDKKELAAKSLLKKLNDNEIDFIIEVLRQLIKLRNPDIEYEY